MKLRETNEQLVKHLLTTGTGTEADPYVLAVSTSAGEGNLPTTKVARLIETVGDTTYIGYSEIGEPTTGDWNIKKITSVGDLDSITFSSGTWDDRATLTYE